VNNVQYIDLIQRPIRKGGRRRQMKVAAEIRKVGVVRLGNHRGWEGEVKVLTPERRVRGLR
jgi:hypothetical protein